MIPAVPVPILCGEKISDSKYTAVGASGLSGYSTTMVTDSVFVSHCTFIRQINLAFLWKGKNQVFETTFCASLNYEIITKLQSIGYETCIG